MERGVTTTVLGMCLAFAGGCSGEGDSSKPALSAGASAAGATPAAGTAGPAGSSAGGFPGSAGAPSSGAGSIAMPSAGSAGGANGPAGGMPAPPIAGTAAAPIAGGAATMGMPPKPPAGAEDGDPNAPVIAVPSLACGPGRVRGIGQTSVMIGGRGVFVAYPCDKHTGAPATFILNLHGTMADEARKLYQVGYFSAHTLVNSHNLIMVSPKAVGSQWGNADDGADQAHLLEVIQWTYDTFKDFDIRAMWVGGHSWGGAYTARFGCLPEIADKVTGLILMSGGGVGGIGAPSCQSKVSVIITTAEGDGRMPSDQTTLATSHGCAAAQSETILMNNHTFWPECMPGFVHANYYMLGKEHATFMDADAVKSIADWIKLARK